VSAQGAALGASSRSATSRASWRNAAWSSFSANGPGCMTVSTLLSQAMPTAEAIPAPGEAPMPAPNAAALLRRNAGDPDIARRPAVRFEDRQWTHAEYVAECRRWANLFLSRRVEGAPLHVGVLLDNVPEYLFAFGGAGLAGPTVVGLNHTRRGEHLQRDVEHADV